MSDSSKPKFRFDGPLFVDVPGASRTPLPTGPAEEFAQTPGSAEVIPQYTDFRGTEALRAKPVCTACGDPLDTNPTYVIVGVNGHLHVSAKLYHPQCVPTYPPVTELAAEQANSDSENIKGPSFGFTNVLGNQIDSVPPPKPRQPSPYSGSPQPFYTHNESELTRLRTVVDRYRVRIATVREALQEILIGLDSDLAEKS